MTQVMARPNENIDALLKRFKRAVEKSGLLADFKKTEFYEKPSVRGKKKSAAAKKRFIKKEKKDEARRDRVGTNKNFKWNRDRTKKIPLRPRSESQSYRPKATGYKPRLNTNGSKPAITRETNTPYVPRDTSGTVKS